MNEQLPIEQLRRDLEATVVEIFELCCEDCCHVESANRKFHLLDIAIADGWKTETRDGLIVPLCPRCAK